VDNFTTSFKMDTIFQILESSKNIETSLATTYTQPTFSRLDQRNYKKIRTLLNRELYLSIERLHRLPSIDEFSKIYKENYLAKFSQSFSDDSAIRYAYSSLVRDLHFYFILKESGFFDVVEINYLFDLQAQTDILVSKGEKRLGLQLFSGDTIAKEQKKRHYAKFVGENNYELFFFGTKTPIGKRKEIACESGSIFILYSLEDAQYILNQLEQTNIKDPLWDESQLEKFDDFVNPDGIIREKKIAKQEIGIEIEFDRAKHSVLCIGTLSHEERDKIKILCDEKGLNFYQCNISESIKVVYDGIGFEEYEELIFDNTDICFNLRQYRIEHALHDEDMIVSAGAGSGKTHTLIARTLYLLDMEYIHHVHEITMITFTNEAADSMREKLSEQFLKLFKLTGSSRYRRYLDELVEMRIMTIPAFARYILTQYGHFLGIGQNFTISSMLMDKRTLIEKYIDSQFNIKKLNAEQLNGLEYYQLQSFIERVYEKVESKGFETKYLPVEPFHNIFSNLVNDALIQVDNQLDELKKEKNTLTLNDLSRSLTQLLALEIPITNLNQQFKYLFIDEFQDTDNVQLSFIVDILVKANIHLLLVGDRKQGIYRFRGANVTAFDLIKEALTENGRQIVEHQLVYNYRTSANLLNIMEDIFDDWRRKKLLAVDSDSVIASRMLPAKCAGLNNENAYKKMRKEISDQAIYDIYKEMIARSKGTGKNVLAILVRTNKQVKDIGKILKESQITSSIPYQVVVEGSLFQSEAAKDLLYLLHSWLNPDNDLARYSFSQTAFCRKEQDVIVIMENKQFYETDSYCYEVSKAWYEALENVKVAPIFMVLNHYLSQASYCDHLESKGYSKVQIKQYEMNLFKVLDIMNSSMNECTDLYSLYKWLKIEHTTNTRDSEAELSDDDFESDYIKVMTVHKAKGLEFNTVIIPFLRNSFVRTLSDGFNPKGSTGENKYSFHDIIAENIDGNPVYGWRYFEKKSKFYDCTEEVYGKLKTDDILQVKQEETRNLYVAMTRAKEQLIFFTGNGNYYGNYSHNGLNNWLDLIGGIN
jgi:superfamily I DNA/RNA helicase